jgi:hypothetical protein
VIFLLKLLKVGLDRTLHKMAENSLKCILPVKAIPFNLNSSEEKIEQKNYFIGNNGVIYMIVCSARKDSINKMQSKIDEVLNSFRIF